MAIDYPAGFGSGEPAMNAFYEHHSLARHFVPLLFGKGASLPSVERLSTTRAAKLSLRPTHDHQNR